MGVIDQINGVRQANWSLGVVYLCDIVLPVVHTCPPRQNHGSVIIDMVARFKDLTSILQTIKLYNRIGYTY